MAADFISVDDSLPKPPAKMPVASFALTAVKADSPDDLWQSGRYQELSALLSRELRRAEVAGDRQALIEIANDLACTHRASGDHETAAYFQLFAATVERKTDEDGRPGRISATSLGNLACDALLAGRLAVAEGLLWKSLLGELAAGTDSDIAADWANLGILAGLLGEFEAAKERLWWALKIHRRLGDSFHTALDLWHLAHLFETDGDWIRARQLFERAAQRFELANHAQFHQAATHQARLNAAREAVLAFDVRLN
jgi:tetratricopeptide (TPR) repeat protein